MKKLHSAIFATACAFAGAIPTSAIASSWAHGTSSNAVLVAAAAARKRQHEAEYQAAKIQAIISPNDQNIARLQNAGMENVYTRFVKTCATNVNPSMAATAEDIKPSVLQRFNTCVNQAGTIAIATSKDEKEAASNGYERSLAQYLLSCQKSNGLKGATSSNVAYAQAEKVIDCTDDKIKDSLLKMFLTCTGVACTIMFGGVAISEIRSRREKNRTGTHLNHY